MKNLLLEGRPGTGKSTLLLKELGEYIHMAAGYRTLRLLDADGKVSAFAQIKPDAGMDVEMQAESSAAANMHIFLEFTGSGKVNHPEVFEYFTLPSMLEAEGNYVLMDEIGGRELAIPKIYEGYKEALLSDRPCIGIIKCDEHAQRFSYEDYRRLKEEIIKDGRTEIVPVDEKSREEAAERIRSWIREQLQQTETA